MYDILILGAGGLGREVYEMACEVYGDSSEYRIKGFLSDVLDILDGYDVDLPLLGTIRDYQVQPQDRFLLAIGDLKGRRKVAEMLMDRGAQFISLIHPRAEVFKQAKLGVGVIIYPLAYVGANAEVGDFCMLNGYTGCGHDTKVGKFSVLSPYAVMAGGSSIGENCFFGIHAGLVPKRHLGNNVRVAAGSIASHNAPDDALISGVPGKRLRTIHC